MDGTAFPALDPVAEALAERGFENFIVASGAWARASGGSTWDYPGIHCFASTAPRRAFNQALIATTGEASDDELRDAIKRFDGTGLRYRVRMRHVIGQEFRPRLEGMGLVHRGGLPALALDGELGEARKTSMSSERVRDTVQLDHHVAVVADAFGWETEELAQVFRPALLDEPGWYGWVGYEDGTPVAAAQLVAHGGTGGLYYVAVAGTHRRKGYGEAITRIAIERARSLSCDIVTLTASPDGYPVYKRLGFRDTGGHVGYTPPDEDL